MGYVAAADLARVAAVCDVDEAGAQQRARRHGAKVYTDYRELARDPDIDAVDIMVPHYLHYPIAREMLENGKHVMVEKPLAVTAALALELCDLAAQRDLKFTVAENTRFVKAYQATERLLLADAIGGPRLIRTFIYGTEMVRIGDRDNWIHKEMESGGGAMIDMAAHSIYLLKWLFGEIAEVDASQWRFVSHIETPDNAAINGILKSGAIFTTQYTEIAEIPWGERLEIYGEKGSIIVDQLNNPPAKWFDGPEDFFGRPLEDVPYWPREWKQNSMIAEVRDFIEAVAFDRPPTIDPYDGAYVIRVIDDAYASFHTNTAIALA
jgi:predicted dehydrogenase